MKPLNCQQLTTKINTIKILKDDFDKEINNDNIKCLEIKSQLLRKIKELRNETWPFKEEALSIEKLEVAYDKFYDLFKENAIIRNGQLAEELVPYELRNEKFSMPTKEQFLKYILEKKEQLERFVALGLVEPIIVPIAADFGKVSEPSGMYRYTGLLDILATKIRKLGMEDIIRDSKGDILYSNSVDRKKSVNIEEPIHISKSYENMRFCFKEEFGGFISANHTQSQFVMKHLQARSPFPGFAIYFKEKGNLLPRVRNSNDPLITMKAGYKFLTYEGDLRGKGLTGSTAHTELILLLSSLQNDRRITRDFDNQSDAAAFMGGISLQNLPEHGMCGWSQGQFHFITRTGENGFFHTACAPIGELI